MLTIAIEVEGPRVEPLSATAQVNLRAHGRHVPQTDTASGQRSNRSNGLPSQGELRAIR